ncbi:Terpenoid cyclases/protein prenyltransferase alpha-alpha toroid [Parasponia andersonii]|uniref:Terpenoid cyclases/protein prenyltransferase alpha-alpha toroid n=1 Tax=Parasponia andersonii TaxID=3476 RepID=A0A2P5BA12_PARAD|nr:Terpenoid cyclases/protein prenyltransferase alpha-alpha toroid [Parasponia andersonii]
MAVALGRKWILDHGGAVGIPSWYLVYTSGRASIQCPQNFGFFQECFIFIQRFVGPIAELVQSLRQEIYTEPYNEINWNKARNTVVKEDLFHPHSLVQDRLWGFLYHYVEPVLARWPFSMLREKALKVAIEHVHYEDTISRYICIASQEKLLSLLPRWVEEPNSEAYKCHLDRIPDYFWVSEDGAKYQSDVSRTWDAALAVQAIISCDLNSMVHENPPGNFTQMYRHMSKGGLPFFVADHGWTVSDCTAEGLKATLLLSQISPELVGEKLDPECIYDAVNALLSFPSNNGGFLAWEPQGAFRWLEEYFSPVEFLQDTIIEQEHIECNSSAIQSLILFRKLYPNHRRKEVDRGICCLREELQQQFSLYDALSPGGWVYTNLEGNRSNLVQTAWAVVFLIVAGQV